LEDHVENEWKDDVDERGDEALNMLKSVPVRPRGTISLDKTGA